MENLNILNFVLKGFKINDRFRLLMTDVRIVFVRQRLLHHQLVDITEEYNKAAACVPACRCTRVEGRRQWPKLCKWGI